MRKLIVPPGMVGSEPQQAQPQLNVNPRSLDDVKCDECGNYTFQNVVLIKRMSPLQSPTAREAFIPMEIFACAVCGHVNDRFIQGMQGWFKKEGAPVEVPTSEPAPLPQPPTAPVTADVILASDIPGLETAADDEIVHGGDEGMATHETSKE